MDIYTASRMTQIEHRQMVRSLRPVPEYGGQVAAKQPSWVSGQAKRLLSAIQNALAAFGDHFKQGQEIIPIDRDQVTN